MDKPSLSTGNGKLLPDPAGSAQALREAGGNESIPAARGAQLGEHSRRESWDALQGTKPG